MKVQPNERGVIESGFKRPEDGWHVCKFLEGIDLLRDKEGEIALTKHGDQLWKFSMIVDDEEDESNEIVIDSIAGEDKRGEQLVGNFLGATGLFTSFAKAFPGDVSVFEQKVMDKIKGKLPGQYWRVKTEQKPYKDKQGQEQIATNIVGFGPMSDSIDSLEAALFSKGGKGSKGKDSAKGKSNVAKAEVEDEDF